MSTPGDNILEEAFELIDSVAIDVYYWQESSPNAAGITVNTYSGGIGVNWTRQVSAEDNVWQSVTFGNGLFVAVSSTGSGDRAMTSPDGINWTIQSSPDNFWLSVTFGNGLFVAVGTGDRVMTSPDGTNWTSQSSPDGSWTSITFGNGLFVAVSDNFSGDGVMTSPDGVAWTLQSTPDNDWTAVTFGNNLFVAVASSISGKRVMTSPDNRVSVEASVQRLDQNDQKEGGLDYNKNYIIVYAPANILPIQRGKSADIVGWEGKYWQVEIIEPWYLIDGWNGVTMVEIPDAPNLV